MMVKEINLKIFMDMYVLIHPEYEKSVFGMLFVYVDVFITTT